MFLTQISLEIDVTYNKNNKMPIFMYNIFSNPFKVMKILRIWRKKFCEYLDFFGVPHLGQNWVQESIWDGLTTFLPFFLRSTQVKISEILFIGYYFNANCPLQKLLYEIFLKEWIISLFFKNTFEFPINFLP